MRIFYFTVYGSGSGDLAVQLDDDTSIAVKLTKEEAEELCCAARVIYERRQATIVAQAQRPFVALADFSEVPF